MTIKKIVLSCLSIFIFFFLINSIWAQENNALTDISNANELYHDKDYIAAAKIFKNLIAEGHVNGYLYFNLGNTHMRLGEIGPAILNYLLAKSLLPRNESIEANLKYAINKTVDRLDPPRTGFIQELFFWVQAASLNEYFQLSILLNIFFWTVSIGYLCLRTPTWKTLKTVSMTALLFVFISTGIKYHLQSSQKLGVIIDKKIAVKSDTGIQNITLFELNEGAIIKINEGNGTWVNISLDTDKTGWVPIKSIGYY